MAYKQPGGMNPFRKNFPSSFKQGDPEDVQQEGVTDEELIERSKAQFGEGAEVAASTRMWDEATTKMKKTGQEGSSTYVTNLQHIAQRTNNPKHIQQYNVARDAYEDIYGESGGHRRSWRTDVEGVDSDLEIREGYGMPNPKDVIGH